MPSDVARILEPQPWMTAASTQKVIAALTAKGASVRFVGGCVRDAVLDRRVKDVDIATPEPPERVMELLKAAGVRVVPTGIKHGTVTAIAGHDHFEITTLREDVETYGRHAKVAFTDDWDADAARRDFTMNAMSCTPEGELHDPFGGYEDALEGRVRFVGDPAARIEEDVLRILRFYRFGAHYGTPPLDPDGRAACRAMAERIPNLSIERVRDELLRLLEAPDPAAILAIMAEDGALAYALPEEHGLETLARLVSLEVQFAEPDRIRRLAALMPDAPAAEGAAIRLRLSNAERRRISDALILATAFDWTMDARERRVTLYLGGAEMVRDAALVAAAKEAPPDEAMLRAVLDQAAAWRAPQLPVGGRDAKALGLADGPAIGEALRRVEQWWIAGDFQASREEALARLRAEIEKA